MDAVPFSVHNDWPKHGDIEGMLRFEDDALTLQYESVTPRGARSGVRELQIPVDELLDVATRRKRFAKGEITLRVKNMALVSDFPARAEGALKLRVAREHETLAEGLRSRLELRMVELELDRELRGQDERSAGGGRRG